MSTPRHEFFTAVALAEALPRLSLDLIGLIDDYFIGYGLCDKNYSIGKDLEYLEKVKKHLEDLEKAGGSRSRLLANNNAYLQATALFAIQNGHARTFIWLLESNIPAYPGFVNKHLWLPESIECGQYGICLYLLEKYPVSPDRKDLLKAINARHLEIFKLIVEEGKEFSAEEMKQTLSLIHRAPRLEEITREEMKKALNKRQNEIGINLKFFNKNLSITAPKTSKLPRNTKIESKHCPSFQR